MEELRRLRQQAGLSQSQLARESGVDRATINKIEQGKRSPSMATLESLARAMGAEVGDFFPKAQAPLLFEDLMEKPRALEDARRETRREFFEHAKPLSAAQLKQLRNSLQRRGAAAELERPELWTEPRARLEEIATRVFIIDLMLQVGANNASETEREEELATLVG